MIHRFHKSRRKADRASPSYLADESGSTLVEFAMITGPFLLILTGIIEVALLVIGSVDLKDSTNDVAREIRVGNAQCMSRAEIKEAICLQTTLLPDCSDRLTVQEASAPLGFGSGMSDLLEGDTFEKVQGGQVVVVESTYRWAIISPLVAELIGDENGDIEIQQSFVFQNETFGAQACP